MGRSAQRLLADAQVDGLGPIRYDVCISCFGVMFFADPVAAFTNIGRALRPGARMALLAWQAPERNEWYSEIDLGGTSPAAPRILCTTRRPTTARTGCGRIHRRASPTCATVYYGADSGQAYDFVTGLQATDVSASLDPAAAEDALRASRSRHTTRDGVLFGARAWIITARTPRRRTRHRGSRPNWAGAWRTIGPPPDAE